MRRLLATMSNMDPLLPGALLGVCLNLCASEAAASDPPPMPVALEAVAPSAAAEAVAPFAPTCDTDNFIADQLSIERPCVAEAKTSEEIADARAYLIETAKPGGTMTRQGPELAIGRLHPEFVVRLAGALREARDSGLSSAGIFSAYRPPAFGVGGFSDKFNSLHTYGLAVDMYGIGAPGSPEARRWHEIAAKHGVVCPYGPFNRAEWNHCQPIRLKFVSAANPLRETVSAAGPLDLESMFEVGSAVIESQASAVGSIAAAMPVHIADLQESPVAKVGKSRRRIMAQGKISRNSRLKKANTKIVRRSGEKARIKASAGGRTAIVVEERRRVRRTGKSAMADLMQRLASRSDSLTSAAILQKRTVIARIQESA